MVLNANGVRARFQHITIRPHVIDTISSHIAVLFEPIGDTNKNVLNEKRNISIHGKGTMKQLHQVASKKNFHNKHKRADEMVESRSTVATGSGERSRAGIFGFAYLFA